MRYGPDGAPEPCSILVHIATAARSALWSKRRKDLRILQGALERSRIRSNDPICADHLPDNRSGDRATHGAACHGCLLIAETNCEMRNLFLDRSMSDDEILGCGVGASEAARAPRRAPAYAL